MSSKQRPTYPSPVTCYLIKPVSFLRRSLRCYERVDGFECPLYGYHNAMNPMDEIAFELDKTIPVYGYNGRGTWPEVCDCGFTFIGPTKQVFCERLYTGKGSDYTVLADAEPGAIWFADWLIGHDDFCGPDGRSLHVRLPNWRDWCVDARASNCTMPNDRQHKCWVRHGIAPNITVDKRGRTCAAGAGSIDVPGWHGLRDGKLVLA